MLRDVEYLVDKLGKVEDFGDLGVYLAQAIKEKELYVAKLLVVPGRLAVMDVVDLLYCWTFLAFPLSAKRR